MTNDASTEDDRIVDNLSNPVFYTETDVNPGEEFNHAIKQWADAALEKDEINDKSVPATSHQDGSFWKIKYDD